jgi:hypothetical protein
MGVFPDENATARNSRDTQQQGKCAKTPHVAVVKNGFYKIVTNDTLPDDNWSSVYD